MCHYLNHYSLLHAVRTTMDGLTVVKSKPLTSAEVRARLNRFVKVHRPEPVAAEGGEASEATRPVAPADGGKGRHRVPDDIVHRLEQISEALAPQAVDEYGAADE